MHELNSLMAVVQVESHDARVLRQLLFSYIKSRRVVAQGQSIAPGSSVKEKIASKRKSMTEKTPQKVVMIPQPAIIMTESGEQLYLPACSLHS